VGAERPAVTAATAIRGIVASTMNDVPRSLKIITVWMLLGLALFLGVQAMQAQQQRARFVVEGGLIEIRRAPDGHYHWPALVNGRTVEFLVDTGATSTALPAVVASSLGLELRGRVDSSTAGGVAVGRLAQVDLQLEGGVRVDRLRVVVLPELGSPLLGMDVLGRLRWQQDAGVLRIEAGGARVD
jgi:aspartyl protease family protein